MPTRDDITELDLERIRALLIDILSSYKYCALFKLQEVYELGIVLISAQGGYKYVSDTYCKSVVDGWQLLVNARNSTSHNLYNNDLVYRDVTRLVESGVFKQIAQLVQIDWTSLDKLISDLLIYVNE